MKDRIFALIINGNRVDPPGGLPFSGRANLPKIIQIGIQLAFLVAVLMALFYLIQGGIQWTTSGGDKQRIEQARLKLTYAIIGLIIVFVSFFIVNILTGFFNIDLYR
jgi:ABC-type Fe3+ transport system permease subunit